MGNDKGTRAIQFGGAHGADGSRRDEVEVGGTEVAVVTSEGEEGVEEFNEVGEDEVIAEVSGTVEEVEGTSWIASADDGDDRVVDDDDDVVGDGDDDEVVDGVGGSVVTEEGEMTGVESEVALKVSSAEVDGDDDVDGDGSGGEDSGGANVDVLLGLP